MTVRPSFKRAIESRIVKIENADALNAKAMSNKLSLRIVRFLRRAGEREERFKLSSMEATKLTKNDDATIKMAKKLSGQNKAFNKNKPCYAYLNKTLQKLQQPNQP